MLWRAYRKPLAWHNPWKRRTRQPNSPSGPKEQASKGMAIQCYIPYKHRKSLHQIPVSYVLHSALYNHFCGTLYLCCFIFFCAIHGTITFEMPNNGHIFAPSNKKKWHFRFSFFPSPWHKAIRAPQNKHWSKCVRSIKLARMVHSTLSFLSFFFLQSPSGLVIAVDLSLRGITRRRRDTRRKKKKKRRRAASNTVHLLCT